VGESRNQDYYDENFVFSPCVYHFHTDTVSFGRVNEEWLFA
jgi:hypothetical protein